MQLFTLFISLRGKNNAEVEILSMELSRGNVIT